MQEGVIKFQLDYEHSPALSTADVRELNAWRTICHQTGLIGQDPQRYMGYGFGNISQRIPPWVAPAHERPFLISGTQTGHLAALTADHYAVVTACYPAQNRVVATGPVQPSSESMTHGTIYALDAAVRFIIHVHSPVLWQAAAELGLPLTAADVPYGTPAMGQEVERLFRETDVGQRRIFGMAGHEDGVVAFGETAAQAGAILLTTLAQALAL